MKENIIEKEWKCSAQKKYYYKNREEHALKVKIYKANNPEKVKQWKRNYYKNNKEKVALYQKEWKAKQGQGKVVSTDGDKHKKLQCQSNESKFQ